jgi:hypothetical protein
VPRVRNYLGTYRHDYQEPKAAGRAAHDSYPPLADNGFFWENWCVAREFTDAAEADVVIVNGDLTINGPDSDAEIAFAAAALGSLRTRVMAPPGNRGDVGGVVHAITTTDFPTKAIRPSNSRLGLARLETCSAFQWSTGNRRWSANSIFWLNSANH